MNLENRKRDSIRGRISANYEDMRLCCVLSAVLQRCAKCCASEQEVYDTKDSNNNENCTFLYFVDIVYLKEWKICIFHKKSGVNNKNKERVDKSLL